MAICTACQGRKTQLADLQCSSCNGKGKVFLFAPGIIGRPAMLSEDNEHIGTCPKCHGTGKTKRPVYCPRCNGTGQDPLS